MTHLSDILSDAINTVSGLNIADQFERNNCQVWYVQGKFEKSNWWNLKEVSSHFKKDSQENFDEYFEKAKEEHKNNFPDDDFLKIKGVGFKVRDLALSCFLKEYSANDFHVVDVLVRTGLILYGYGDLNFGTNPNDEKNYLFLRNLIVKISKQAHYSPGEIDRIFWHFGRAICKNKPLCEECPIKNICLTYKNNEEG